MPIFPATADGRRTAVTAGVAALVHVALLSVSVRTLAPHPRSPTEAPADDPADTIEVALLAATSLPPHAPGPIASGAAATDRAVLRGATGARPEAIGAASVTGEPSAPPAPSPSPSPPSSSAPVTLFAPSAPAIGIAGDGPNPFVASGDARAQTSPPGTFHSAAPDAPTTAETKQSVEQSLKTAMRARDADVGLGPEGPVIRALEDATSMGLAPERGNAMFLAVVDAGGLVVDVRLVSSTGGGDWNDVRRRAAHALAGTKLALRGAKGAELKIRVDADIRLPSGNKPGRPIRPTFSDSHVVLPENAPGNGTAGVVETHTLANFDVTDIGAKPRRVVHAHLVSLTTL